jgi:ribosome-associated toxin RatA of RatAB toxin-antitoxin module
MSTKILHSISIQAEPETVFDYTQDYHKRTTWDTFLIEAKLINGATQAAKGVKAWCVAKNGKGMETEYITYNRPKVTAVKMTKGPYMFKSFAGSWQFEKQGKETLVTFNYTYRLRFPHTIAKPMIKLILDKNVKQRLVDLKNCIEKK